MRLYGSVTPRFQGSYSFSVLDTTSRHPKEVGEPEGQVLRNGAAHPVDATPSGVNLFLKGGVSYAETMETVFGPAGRYVEPLEGWTVVKCDWSSTQQR